MEGASSALWSEAPLSSIDDLADYDSSDVAGQTLGAELVGRHACGISSEIERLAPGTRGVHDRGVGVKWLSTRAVRAMLWIVCVAFALHTHSSAQEAQRPVQYPARWSQFFIRGSTDPRVVTMLRLGAGPDRPAEFSVFEIVRNGQRLRQLYKPTVLRNELMPRTWVSLGQGRFLVTFNDRFLSSKLGDVVHGSTDNALVIYDLARNESVARRVDEFLPAEYLEDHRDTSGHGVGYRFDPLRLVFYPTALYESKPFLTIDLPSLSLRYSPVPPARLPEEVVNIREVATGLGWEWSMGRGEEKEPAWDEALALPKYLKGTAAWDLERLHPIWGDDETMYFKYEPRLGDYLRCPAEEWVDPPWSR